MRILLTISFLFFIVDGIVSGNNDQYGPGEISNSSNEDIYGPGEVNSNGKKIEPADDPYAQKPAHMPDAEQKIILSNDQIVNQEELNDLGEPVQTLHNGGFYTQGKGKYQAEILPWNNSDMESLRRTMPADQYRALRIRNEAQRMRDQIDQQYGISPTSEPEQFQEQPQGISINIKQNAPRRARNSGAINPVTGEHYPSSGNGYVNPRDGRFYAPAGPSGVVDTKTGQFIPIHK